MRHRDFIKEKRQIRVFISSSFEDMDNERNYLRDVVFPLIQENARKRAVAVTALDLRWGIPDGTDLGETIEICMNEIDNSFPFFIGIVGGHYGTQPDKNEVFDSNVILREQFSALSKYFEKRLSITEMEMRYGVLDCDEDERKRINALFLTRKADLEAINKDARLNVLNKDIQDCGERFDEALITHDTKNHIWTSDYSSIEEFGRIVEVVFEDILDRLFPEEKNQDNYQRQFFMQESVLTDLSRFYVPNNNQIQAINSFVDDPYKRLMLINGESGCGKSSLLAYWISTQSSEYSKKGVDCIYHFVGAGGTENDYKVIEKRLLHELITGLEIEPRKDEEKNSINSLFCRTNLREERKILLIIDAVNQLETGLDLSWLRLSSLPQDVKLIISTLIGDHTEQVIKKYDPGKILTVNGLSTSSDRKRAIELYVKDFHGRNLGDDNLNRIVKWPLSQNPLALKTLLNELIVAGRYDKMDSLVTSYVTCSSIDSLFDHILVRMNDNPHYFWVSNALGAIALSRYGLSEDEILKIIPTHILHWSSFYCSFQRHFFIRNGLITFSHQYVRQAVERICLAREDTRKQIHSSLIPLFKEGKTAREQEELMHHYFALGDYQAVFSLVSNPAIFTNLWSNDEQNLISYWEKLITKGYSPKNLILNYKQFDELGIEISEEHNGSGFGNDYSGYCADLQRLLYALHLHDLSIILFQTLEEHTKEAGTFGLEHSRMYRIIAGSYEEIGELERAIELYKKSFWELVSFNPDPNMGAGSVFRTGFDENSEYADPMYTDVYISISSCYRRLGRFDEAKQFLNLAKQSIDSNDETSSRQAELVSYLMEHYRYSSDNGNYDEANSFLRTTSGKTASYQNVAERYSLYGDYPKAISTWHKYIRLLKGDSSTFTGVEASIAYREIAEALINLEKYSIAVHFIKASFNSIAGRKDTDYLKAKNYVQLGRIHYFKKEYAASLEYYLKAVGIFEKMKLWPEWLDVCQQAANVSSWNKNTQQGLSLLRKALEVIENEKCCSDFQKGQLLWTMSGLEHLLGFYNDCFEHARSAFKLIIMKLGPNDEQSLKIIQRLDNCIVKAPSIKKQLTASLNSSNLSEWDKFVLLSEEQSITPQLKVNLICNELSSLPNLWVIITSIIKVLEQPTVVRILQAKSIDGLFDRIISCIERDFNKEFLMRVFMTVILSSDGVDESRLFSLSKNTKQGAWDTLTQRYGAIFTKHNGNVCLAVDASKSAIISHYFRYDVDDDHSVLMRFADEMSQVCPNTLFSHIGGKPFYKQLKQDSDALKRYLTRTVGLNHKDIIPVLTQEMLKVVSKYCSSHDDITMMLLIRYFNSVLITNGVDDEITQRVANELLECTNFESAQDTTRGYVYLVLGLKAYNDTDYKLSLSYLSQYCLLAYSNDAFDIRMRWYKIVNECLGRLETFERDDIVPMGFMGKWEWESNKYKFLNNSLIRHFSISDVKEDKENKQITIKLDENTGRIYTDKASHKFRFLRYVYETQIAMKGKVQVILCCRRGYWEDLDDNTEQTNLYPIKYSDGVKLKDFKTLINTIFKKWEISTITDTILTVL